LLLPAALFARLACAGVPIDAPIDSFLNFSGSLPEPTHRETAIYPDQAFRAGLGGMVLVRVLVGRTGKLERTEIEKSDPLFDESALRAARQFRFDPVVHEGETLRVWVRMPFRFKLGDPATDPRVLSDSLWRDRWSATPAIMRQQRESFLRMMKKADEVWLFRLDPNSEAEVAPASVRSRFGQRAILDEASIEKDATRAKLRTLLTDVRTHARPPRVKGEFTPRLGIRFVTSGEVVDVLVSFADAALFVKDGRHLWAGSAMPHWREWGQLAHAAFPDDPNFARYATTDPMTP